MSSNEGSTMMSLKNRMQSIMEDLDHYKSLYERTRSDLEEEKKQRSQADVEIGASNRRIRILEDELEQVTAKLNATNERLSDIAKAADECERSRRALEHRKNMDEDRLLVLEQMLKETSEAALESEKKYDELFRKVQSTEADLERAEAKVEASETKAKSVVDDMRTLTNKLKALQQKVEKASEREDTYEATISQLKASLKNAENHQSESETAIARLQREVDRLQDELSNSKSLNQSLQGLVVQ